MMGLPGQIKRKVIALRLCAFLCFFFYSRATHSQVLISLVLGDKLNTGEIEFGLDGGINWASQTGVDGIASSRFNLGFYFDFKMKGPWMFHTGVIVKSSLGAEAIPVYSLADAGLDSAFRKGSVERKLNYFHVPFMMKYNFKNHFYLEAGPMLALYYGGHDEFVAERNGQELTYKVDLDDRFQRIDAGILAGIGYRLMKGNGMNLGIRYYEGLMDAVKDNPGDAIRNRSFYAVVGIPIGVGKAKKRAEERNEQF